MRYASAKSKEPTAFVARSSTRTYIRVGGNAQALEPHKFTSTFGGARCGPVRRFCYDGRSEMHGIYTSHTVSNNEALEGYSSPRSEVAESSDR